MKKLILIGMTLFTLSVHADVFTFEKCTESDKQGLTGAHLLNVPLMNEMISDYIVPSISTCEVMKPRVMFPAVCGQRITQTDHYKITTDFGKKFEIITKVSYTSCQRARVYKRIDFFKMLEN